MTEGNPLEARENISRTFLVFERAKALTRQLLTFAKGGAPCCKAVSMARLLRECVQFSLSGTNVTGQFAIANDLWSISGDEHQIGQVISNLVINATQAMPSGGTIIITADNIAIGTDDAEHSGAEEKQGDFVRLSIKDHGTGIPEEIIGHIFDPFFSTKETGHGLGLATVFSIVRRHDGWIDVTSAPGAGSTFTVFIPATALTLPVPVEQMEPEADYCGRGTVLAMDDEPFMIDVLTGMLSKCGYTVVPASDGHEALMLFIQAEEAGKPFAASILDLTVRGGMGGMDTLTAIRKINAECIVIATSGYADNPIMAKPADFGFTDSIVKPFRCSELKELFERLCTPEHAV